MDRQDAGLAAIKDAEFKKHQGLLHTFTRKCFARLKSAGVVIEYDDVFQVMCESWLRAYPKYEPSHGSFSAYFGRCCYNNFNKWAEKLIAEQMGLGLIRMADLSSEDEESALLDDTIMKDETPSFEDQCVAADAVREKIERLSKDARRVAAYLIAPPEGLRAQFDAEVAQALADKDDGLFSRVPKDITFSMIGRFLKIPPRQVGKIKQELSATFGVSL
jgi:DNA-directed RNA polymerase specialized sigma24 family protein